MMRSLAIFVALTFWGSSAATAQSAATRLPSSASDSAQTTTYETGGIRVVQRYATSSDIVVANLYLLGGVRQVTERTAGIEPLLLDLTERGTRIYPKERLRRQMARLGTSIAIEPDPDWTTIGIRATRTTLDSTWAVFASRVMQPTLDSSEFELVRRQFVAAVRQRKDSPDALLEFLADSFAFAGHPYALTPTGTEASLSALRLADLRQYHAEQFVKSRMLLVVVGNVPRAKVEQLVGQTLAHLPVGTYRWTLPDSLPRSSGSALVIDRALPTNYIMARYAGPMAGTKDYVALRIASAVLSGQFFGEVRSRRNLSYAVEAPFVERAVAAGGVYVTTVSPDVTLDVMRQQLNGLKTGILDVAGLETLVAQFTTQYFLDNESNDEQANFLARAYLFNGDIAAASHFAADMQSVTPDDVRRAAQRYMKDMRFVYLGDAKRAPTRLMEKF
ncbi:MAG: pitrilysin family protein [Gemmatimonadaceae bacterium]